MGFFQKLKLIPKATTFSIDLGQIKREYWHKRGKVDPHIGPMNHDEAIWIALGPCFDRAIEGKSLELGFYKLALILEKGGGLPDNPNLEKLLLLHISTFRKYIKQMGVYDDIEKATELVLGMEFWRKQKGLEPTGFSLLVEEFGYIPDG